MKFRKLLRGGSWTDDCGYTRSAYRYIYIAADRYINYGFRVMEVK